ncbi:hypothetical protein PV326_006135 [Microctonus aethiopoides]|nr:hypothetical protein PV326_006135 [Microctonus aethiopoides]
MFLSDAQFVIIVFDTYKSPSIKDKEHTLRGTSRGRKIVIRGTSMRPFDFSAELKNITFKEDLVEYLLATWGRREMAPFLGNKIVYVNYKECHRYQIINVDVVKTMEHSQSCSGHEKADSKIIYHACNFEELQPPHNITIRCSDTDILVIMLGNMKFVQEQMEVLMEVGVGKTQRNINLSLLYKSLAHIKEPSTLSPLDYIEMLDESAEIFVNDGRYKYLKENDWENNENDEDEDSDYDLDSDVEGNASGDKQ